jgi:hypothetical protein
MYGGLLREADARTAWTIVFLPSSLFVHFNINLQRRERLAFEMLNKRPDAAQLHFLRAADDGGRASALRGIRRSSLVFYNQGSVFQYRANGDRSNKQAAMTGDAPATMPDWASHHLR